LLAVPKGFSTLDIPVLATDFDAADDVEGDSMNAAAFEPGR
jgi:hypothetical protein